MSNSIDNKQDVIDSRDIISRIGELISYRDCIDEAKSDLERFQNDPKCTPDDIADAEKYLAEQEEAFEDEDREELKILESLAEDAEGYAPDWIYGATLIRESYFEDYCQELVSDIGDLPKNIPSYIAIDWAKTADNLRVDYTEVDYDGVTYLIR